MTGFKVTNGSQSTIEVFISKYTNKDHGSDAWYTLQDGASDTWNRNGYEILAFKDPKTGDRRGWYLDCTDQTREITFRGFDRDLEIDHPTGFNIRNASGSPVQIFVSAFTNGLDSVFDVPTDFSDRAKCHWNRNGWELLAFIDPVSKKQRGWYLNTDGQTVDVTFNGFDKELTIFRPSK
ncbi:hypothetical protein CPC08DRAFT_823175 [Agrocybe pediades]|nr:hypothetical protein CPC08DRAFT_823175 [Agrocybe pediades]